MWTKLVAGFSRLGFAWARRRLDNEARLEFDLHLDLLADRYIRSGMAPGEARDAARRQLGNLTLVNLLAHIVAAMDPELVVYRAAPLAEVVGRGVSRQRFALVLMGAFAGVSVMLAALGLYGVLAYTMRQRTKEIGIRIALGATADQVRALVLRQAALVLATGLVAGTAGALLLGRWLTSLVFQTSPSDPRILLATALVLTVTGLIAAWLPARRASQVEPRIAMQEGD